MLFQSPEKLKPCGLFSIGHLILLTITLILIVIALKCTKKKSEHEVKRIIQKTTIFLWILELIKIVYTIINYGVGEVNKYIPLYFCSLILYAGIFSGFCKGKLKHAGDVFLATGGIIAGIIFLLYPLTSLTQYPIFHYISLQSFILHGSMLYIGLLVIKTKYIKLEKKDIVYYAVLIIVISLIAYIINIIFDSNLMFISKNYPGTYIEIIYNLTGKIFPIVMILAQATLPFYVVYGVYLIYKKQIS